MLLSISAAPATGRPTGVVLTIGVTVLAVPIYQGHALPHAIRNPYELPNGDDVMDVLARSRQPSREVQQGSTQSCVHWSTSLTRPRGARRSELGSTTTSDA